MSNLESSISQMYANIYKTSRKKTALTQEVVAEKIGISVESVRSYETNQRIPPNEVVSLMVELYCDLILGDRYLEGRCVNLCAVGS